MMSYKQPEESYRKLQANTNPKEVTGSIPAPPPQIHQQAPVILYTHLAHRYVLSAHTNLHQIQNHLQQTENVTALLFLVAVSGYDQCLVEDKDAVSLSFGQIGKAPGWLGG